jgi:copper chaperone
VLTVKSEGITQEQEIETVQKAGFKIEPLNKDNLLILIPV